MKSISRVLLISVALIASSLQAAAVLTVPSPDRTNVAIGTPTIFAGAITNNSGAGISSEDIFFSFSGFTTGAISFSELNPATPFTVADGATSPLLNLFSATLLSGAESNLVYSGGVILQDFQGDVSPAVTVSLSSAPEPASIGLLLLGIGALSLPVLRAKGGR